MNNFFLVLNVSCCPPLFFGEKFDHHTNQTNKQRNQNNVQTEFIWLTILSTLLILLTESAYFINYSLEFLVRGNQFRSRLIDFLRHFIDSYCRFINLLPHQLSLHLPLIHPFCDFVNKFILEMIANFEKKIGKYYFLIVISKDFHASFFLFIHFSSNFSILRSFHQSL